MKRVVILGLFSVGILFVTACSDEDSGDQPSNTNAVYGTWSGIPALRAGDLEFNAKFRFEPGKATTIITCSTSDNSVTSSVTGKAEYSDNKIRFTEKKSHTEKKDGLDCTASLEEGEFEYSVDGNKLKLTQNGESFTLTKE